jgi:FkbH-like protein
MFWKRPGASRKSSAPTTLQDTTRLSKTLLSNRHALAFQLMTNLADWSKYATMANGDPAAVNDSIKLHFYAFIDYIYLYFSTGDLTYKSLYISEKLKQLYDPSLTVEQDAENRFRVTERDIQVLCGYVNSEAGSEEAAVLESLLRDIQRVVTARGLKELNVLLIGDCIYLDIMGFLAPLVLEDGIGLRPTYITTRNPIEQRNVLRQMLARPFDVIFYSPFTYEFSTDFAALHDWRRSLVSQRRIDGRVSAAIDEVEQTLEVLEALCDTPTYVHNTVNIRRHNSTLREIAKTLMTYRTRRLARLSANRLLDQILVTRRAANANLILFDEAGLLDDHSELCLGRSFYTSPLQHPAELGRVIADHYREVLTVHSDLISKKVVVCDLDNTLWKGEIGEGTVEHFIEPQRTLKELKRKGVLLTVNSKNDARNVRWNDALLNQDDFVNLQINWDSKVSNMRRIQQALNLKFKDFVFIDDRADQRLMVREAIPEIHILDPMNSRTWAQLGLWAGALPETPETDRTQQYREREHRESYLAAATINEDPTIVFSKLEIHIEIREAKPSELKRVTELINRTNQFNLMGSRLSLREIREWHQSAGREIAIVEASDKYGTMGTVCVVLLDLTGTDILIPVFVLSCRVFGYGIEDAVLNMVKRRACGTSEREARCIQGEYHETPYNDPCRKMYPENGFSWDGRSWIWVHDKPIKDPSWLTIVDSVSIDALRSV